MGGRLLDWEATRFHQAAARLGLDRAVACAPHCARSIEVDVPLERDDGTPDIYTGDRIQHIPTRWAPAKGGVHYHPSVTASEVGCCR